MCARGCGQSELPCLVWTSALGGPVLFPGRWRAPRSHHGNHAPSTGFPTARASRPSSTDSQRGQGHDGPLLSAEIQCQRVFGVVSCWVKIFFATLYQMMNQWRGLLCAKTLSLSPNSIMPHLTSIYSQFMRDLKLLVKKKKTVKKKKQKKKLSCRYRAY